LLRPTINARRIEGAIIHNRVNIGGNGDHAFCWMAYLWCFMKKLLDDDELDELIAAARANSAELLHARRCPSCEQKALKPFEFPSKVWGLRCQLCGQGHIVADWATRGHNVWIPEQRDSTYEIVYI
jgi:hypothetical protein